MKPPRSKQQLLDAAPDVVHYVPKLSDKYLVIATDGLWDVMSSQAVMTMIDEQLLPYKIDLTKTDVEVKTILNEVSNRICVHAWKNLNSKDNITMAIILLQWRPNTRMLSSTNTQNNLNYPQQKSRNNSVHIDQLISEVSDALLSKDQAKFPSGASKSSEVLKEDDVMKFLLDDTNF